MISRISGLVLLGITLLLVSNVNGYSSNCIYDIVSFRNDMNRDLMSYGLYIFPGSRENAISTLSMYDALNIIDRQYRLYLHHDNIPLSRGKIKHANLCAAAYEAFRVSTNNHTKERLQDDCVTPFQPQAATDDLIARVNSFVDGGLALISDKQSRINDAKTIGRVVAQNILEHRWNDGWNRYVVPHDPAPAIGKWYNTYPGAHYTYPQFKYVTPFVVTDKDSLVPGPPPALDSAIFERDEAEVKRVGRKDASLTDRPQRYSDIARFWADYGVEHVSKIAVTIAVAQGLSLHRTIHLATLGTVGQADGMINNGYQKFLFGFFRPVHAIVNARNLDYSAYPFIVGLHDTTWSSFIFTPNNEDYPAGHATNTAAGIYPMVLAANNVDNLPSPVSVTFTNTNIPAQVYSSYSQIMEEVNDARIYGGIHRRNSCEVGTRVGKNIGQMVFQRFSRTDDYEGDE